MTPYTVVGGDSYFVSGAYCNAGDVLLGGGGECFNSAHPDSPGWLHKSQPLFEVATSRWYWSADCLNPDGSALTGANNWQSFARAYAVCLPR